MAASTGVSLEEYLNTSYRPDVEYIDGQLKEKPVPTWEHSRLQIMIGAWFDAHENEWGVLAGSEARTQVFSSRVRLPDVVVVPAGPHPLMLVEAPLIVVEILSPDDTYAETQRRARDYQDMGVENIWLIDPDTRTARVCKGQNWTETTRFAVQNSAIYLDVEALFARLDKYKPLG